MGESELYGEQAPLILPRKVVLKGGKKIVLKSRCERKGRGQKMDLKREKNACP